MPGPEKDPERDDSGRLPPPVPWETGPPEGRGLYERQGRYGNNLRYIGLMESDERARHVVSIHNSVIEARDRWAL